MNAVPKKIMGGMLGTEDYITLKQPIPEFLKRPCLKVLNGRSAMYILCDAIKPQKVWLPSYLCRSIIEAVPTAITIEFYPIDKSLNIGNMDWVDYVQQDELVLFIDYFGFDLHRKCMKKVKNQGAWILQDAAHSLLSSFDRPYADFILYSPRKLLGVPDGGILQSKCLEDFSGIKLDSAPIEFVLASYYAYISRTVFDNSSKNDWFDLYKKAEEIHPTGYYEISDFSLALLTSGFNYSSIVKKRRENYNALYDQLEAYALFGEMPNDVAPLGFPAIFDNRDELLAELHNESIFCPVHWPVPEVLPCRFDDSYMLNKIIVTLLCDQRMDSGNIDHMISIIKRCL